MRRADFRLVAVLAMTAYAVAVVVVALLALRSTPDAAASGMHAAPAVSATASPDVELVSVDVEQGATAEMIARRLVDSGAIADGDRFTLLLHFTGIAAELKAGPYDFAPGTPAIEVIRRMRAGETSERLIAIPEGRRVEEVGLLLVDAGVVSWLEWLDAIEEPWTHPVLEGRPEGVGLNGYLFPASYPFSRTTTAEEAVTAMLDSLQAALDSDPTLRADIDASGMTLYEVLTLASIVEREAVVKEERPVIASVFLNRLRDGIALQADPTVQYAITEQSGSETSEWWKVELTVDDLAFDSPYNTYLYPGLPPGPIANPGLDAIVAVVRPADTNYFYFVARGDGSHVFAETLEEHNANVAQYRDGGE
jgi:UPF0755 protein